MSGRTCRGSRCTISSSRSTVGPATSASDEGTDADDRTIVTCFRRCRAQGLQNRAAGARPDRGDGAGPRAHAVRNHCRQIAQALGKPAPWASASTPFSLSSPRPARRPALKRDPCAKGELAFGRLPHGLWVHPEVPDSLGGMTPLRRRLGIVLQHLAAHGRTTVVKGCRDAANRGCGRSPLGGSGGMQYYLWWTVQGSAPARDITFPGRGVRPRARGPAPRRRRASRRQRS